MTNPLAFRWRLHPGWCGVMAILSLGNSAAQVGQPGNFQAAIDGLNRKLFIQRVNDNTYDISGHERVQYDPAVQSIFVRPIGTKLGDQGLAVAVALLPNWCETPFVRSSTFFLTTLTAQMAESQALKQKYGRTYATRSHMGQCEISTTSNGWQSVIQLRWVGGQGIWPVQKLAAIRVKP